MKIKIQRQDDTVTITAPQPGTTRALEWTLTVEQCQNLMNLLAVALRAKAFSFAYETEGD